MRMLRFIALTIVAVLSFAAVADACLATDLNNTSWYVYITGTHSWTRCIVNIGAAGAVTPGTACKHYSETTKLSTTESVTGGTILVNTSCFVSNRTLKTSISLVHTITEASLDRAKNVLAGVGKDPDGSSWTFTAIRQGQ